MEPDGDLDAMLSEPVRAHHCAIIIIIIIIASRRAATDRRGPAGDSEL